MTSGASYLPINAQISYPGTRSTWRSKSVSQFDSMIVHRKVVEQQSNMVFYGNNAGTRCLRQEMAQ